MIERFNFGLYPSDVDIIRVSQVNRKWRHFCTVNNVLNVHDTEQSIIDRLENEVKSFDSVTIYAFEHFKMSQEWL